MIGTARSAQSFNDQKPGQLTQKPVFMGGSRVIDINIIL